MGLSYVGCTEYIESEAKNSFDYAYTMHKYVPLAFSETKPKTAPADTAVANCKNLLVVNEALQAELGSIRFIFDIITTLNQMLDLLGND